MDWITLEDVHWLAVALATLSSFAVGALWYSPKVFGTKWAGYTGINMDDGDKDGLVAIMVVTFVAAAITAPTLSTTASSGDPLG